MRKIIKDLNDKIFKHHIYIEYYDIALDLVQILGLEETLNITFSKELQISKEYLI